MIELDYGLDRGAKIRIVGIGGGGGNAINEMIKHGLVGVDFFAINTDTQELDCNKAPNKIQIGKNLTRGFGARVDPIVGHRAVEEDRDEIAHALAGSDMVFVIAGMGGGTGTGGGPLVANIAKSIGALVVGIVTRPFQCEGKRRMGQADSGIEEMKKQVDTLIVIPNQKLLSSLEWTFPRALCTEPDKWKDPPGVDAPEGLVREYLVHLSECKYHFEKEAISDSLISVLVTEAFAQNDIDYKDEDALLFKKNNDSLEAKPEQHLSGREKLSTQVNTTDRRRIPLTDAFGLVNAVLYAAVRGITELITVPGLINVDFADVRTVMKEMGDAVMGSGNATGENRGVEAARAAISSPLLDDVSIAGAQGVLVNITGGPSMSLVEVDEATEIVHDAAGEDANVILGAVVDESMTDEIMVTVIVTGFNRRTSATSISAARSGKPIRLIDRVPTGTAELQKLDEAAFMRRGVDITFNPYRADESYGHEKVDKTDPEKPTFLKKIMD